MEECRQEYKLDTLSHSSSGTVFAAVCRWPVAGFGSGKARGLTLSSIASCTNAAGQSGEGPQLRMLHTSNADGCGDFTEIPQGLVRQLSVFHICHCHTGKIILPGIEGWHVDCLRSDDTFFHELYKAFLRSLSSKAFSKY